MSAVAWGFIAWGIACVLLVALWAWLGIKTKRGAR